jgi:hypothetical protein
MYDYNATYEILCDAKLEKCFHYLYGIRRIEDNNTMYRLR